MLEEVITTKKKNLQPFQKTQSYLRDAEAGSPLPSRRGAGAAAGRRASPCPLPEGLSPCPSASYGSGALRLLQDRTWVSFAVERARADRRMPVWDEERLCVFTRLVSFWRQQLQSQGVGSLSFWAERR